MKKLFLFLVLCTLGLNPVLAQKYGKGLLFSIPFDSATEKFAVQGVEEVADVSADDLFMRVKAWMQIKTGKEHLDYDSLGTHILIQRMSFPFTLSGQMVPIPGFMRFKVQIETKPGRYRYTITNFETANGAEETESSMLESWYETNRNFKAGKKIHTKMLNDLVEQTEEGTNKLIKEFKAAISGEKKDDW